jgi:hypothetical protein
MNKAVSLKADLHSVLRRHDVDAADPWIAMVLSELEQQIRVLLDAVGQGELSKQRFTNLMLFKVDAVLAAVYAQQGLNDLQQDRLRVDVLQVLDKPLKSLLGVDLLV